eukprot:scaffold30342_cov61-Cyclotella_meneghiniana.AAC.2
MLEWRAYYLKWLYVIEAAQSGLDLKLKVLFVYFLQSGRHIGTDESIVVWSEVTAPKSGASIVHQMGTLSADIPLLIATGNCKTTLMAPSLREELVQLRKSMKDS